MSKTKPKKRTPQTGLFWHLHHRILAEWCYCYHDRRVEINSTKRGEEGDECADLRLKLFKPIRIRKAPAWLKAVTEESRVIGGYKWRSNDDFHNILISRRKWAELNRLHKKQCKNCPWGVKKAFSILPS